MTTPRRSARPGEHLTDEQQRKARSGHVRDRQSPHEATTIEQRRERVARYVLAGVTYREAAAELDVSLATVHSDVQALKDGWRERYAEDYHEHAALELAKLEQVERRLWQQIADSGGGRQLAAIESWIKLSRRRAQLLGLDRPERIEATVRHDPPATDGRTIAEVLTSAMAMAKAESTKVESNGGGSDSAER
jgi:transposase